MKEKLKNSISKLLKILKRQHPMYQIIIVSIFMLWLGWICRGFKFINWATMDYGSVADWFSGVGTILAILSSFYFFKEENSPSISISQTYHGDFGIILTATNVGRVPVSARFFGFQLNKDGVGHSFNSYDEVYEIIEPGGSIKTIEYNARDILNMFGNEIDSDTVSFKATFMTSRHVSFSKDLKIKNGTFGG
ncbi:hypothetical protein [Companilactobacillus zhachilii]|uniref:hypothetical protein n=1 Tax=Companilactobacillus zhachilii TaxID=2304606 RepID=UPI004034254A